MKTIGKVFLGILAVILVIGIMGVIAGTRHMKEVKIYNIPEIDMMSIADGQYEGSCNIGRWANKVIVTVKDHKITSVIIPGDQFPILPDEFIVELNDKIVGLEEPDFEAVTGATISSKAYMIAITDALTK
jgi:uncharacterized protein with FMN-binding domain